MIARIERHPSGPRLYVLGRRRHHWEVGAALIGVGAWLVFDDRHDLPRRQAPRVPLPVWDPEIGVTTSHGVW